MRKVDVIVPVYRGYEETKACIETALATLDSSSSNLIIINDCSPEPKLSEYLRDCSNKGLITLLENEENLGFVATVNKGMSLNEDNDVLLLNSDVEVANNWLERIRDSAYLDDKIGSVTPFSNNATICSFPNFCEDNELFLGLNVEEIDEIFSGLQLESSYVEIPTGVGFCMYIKRECLNDVGLFDVETFGKGYGEENDWCQRAIRKGWKNTHALNVFAYHKGGVSFAGEQNPRKEKALELLNGLYPNYQPDVISFIDKDPANIARVKAVLAFISQSTRYKILMISHGLGGGVVTHIDELADYYADDIISIVLNPLHDNIVELSFKAINVSQSLYFDLEENIDEFIEVLSFLNIDRIHFHHLMGVPSSIVELPAVLSCEYDFTVHDYYLLNGNPTLTNKEARFIGDNEDIDKFCGDITTSGKSFRTANEVILAKASRVIFPSIDTFERYSKYFELSNAVVSWHPDNEESVGQNQNQRNLPDNNKDNFKVLVLGALSREKGAEVLEKVANELSGNNIEFHLLGYAFRPLANVITHGAYDNDQIDALISDIEPDVIWFPALWPETYSYTLSAAIRSSVFIVAPNLGAFTERLLGSKNNCIVTWDHSDLEWAEFWKSFVEGDIRELENSSSGDVDLRFYSNRYLEFEKSQAISRNLQCKDLKQFTKNKKVSQLGNREHLVRYLVRLRDTRLFSWMSSFIPLSFQKKVKRMLSKKPIHEIIKK